MITYEDECVGCPAEMGCMGDACPNKNVRHLYCDRCNADVETLYVYYGQEFCLHCLIGQVLEQVEKITL